MGIAENTKCNAYEVNQKHTVIQKGRDGIGLTEKFVTSYGRT